MDSAYKSLLKKQGYHFVGGHSAIKTCEWTRRSLAERGVCYKQKFYGINCHRCIQLSVAANFCNLDCVFCWRERSNSDFGKIDKPKIIIENSIFEQGRLLAGFKGNPNSKLKKVREALKPVHFAISLTGENLVYPKINELVKGIKKIGCSSFIVTNGQMPNVMEKLEPPTQLYVSISAPNKELFSKINKPLHEDGWEKLLISLKVLKKMKNVTRTVIRLTSVKGLNMDYPKEFGALIKIAEPHFLEVKAYMHLGASKKRLKLSNMPTHKEVRNFAEEIGKFSGYKIIDEQPVSRVVLMMKKDFPWRIMKFEEPQY